MKVVEILMGEHVVIREFLSVLDSAAARIGTENGPPPEFFDKAVSFCREYADRAHHYKEEYLLFGRLAEKHEGKIDAQITRHRDQHESLRNLVQEIHEATDGYGRGEEEATRVLTRDIAEYVHTLRKHIVSENEVFFPMAEIFLSEEEGEALLVEFEKYDHAAGSGSWSRARELVGELEAAL